jgi:hypothetical protein
VKRYLLFGGEHYYPSGGWQDFQKDFDTLEAAQAEGAQYDANRKSIIDWWHVYDTQENRLFDRDGELFEDRHGSFILRKKP